MNAEDVITDDVLLCARASSHFLLPRGSMLWLHTQTKPFMYWNREEQKVSSSRFSPGEKAVLPLERPLNGLQGPVRMWAAACGNLSLIFLSVASLCTGAVLTVTF